MKKPNSYDTLLTLPINPLEASAMFGVMVANSDLLNLSPDSLIGQVFMQFGHQLSNQGFIKGMGEGKITNTDKEGDATFEIPVWGVMVIAEAILTLKKVTEGLEHLHHMLLWDPFVQKANRIVEFGETEESASAENFLSMN